MLLTNNSLYKYTPDEMSEQSFLERFVVRDDIFNDIFDDIKSIDYKVQQQHYLIVGQRGQGKTTLLRKIQLEIKNDKKLSSFLLPIKFAEEQYSVRTLSRLWEEIADYLELNYNDDFPTIYEDIEKHFEDDDYDLKSFTYLESAIKKQNKKLVLLLDNIDELFEKLKSKEIQRLREILLSSSTFRIIGGSTKMFDQQFDYSKPFYEFFKIIKLQGLNFEDSKKFMLALGNEEQKKKILKVITDTSQRLETLRRLTTGVPRTLVILYEIFLNDDGNAFDDLLKILDEVTPLYKHRMDDLPPTLQEIVHTLAINWDGMMTGEIAKKMRMESKAVSSQLKQLEKYEIIDAISTGKNKIYMIKERFFNIWYLMRNGRKSDRQRVEWLVQFLLAWYDTKELESKAKRFTKAIESGEVKSNYAFYMCEALSYAGVSGGVEHYMKDSVKDYLNKIDSSLQDNMEKSDFEILNEFNKLQKNNKIDDAFNMMLKSHKNNKLILGLKGMIYYKKDDIDNAICYLSKAIDKQSPIISIYNILSDIYMTKKGDLENAKLISEKGFNIEKNWQNTITLAIIYLSNLNFLESYKYFKESLKFEISNRHKGYLEIYLTFLIKLKQYNKAKEFLELPKYKLKEHFKPIWYALMYFMQDEYPNEYKKMGSELKESVEEMIKKIESLRVEESVLNSVSSHQM